MTLSQISAVYMAFKRLIMVPLSAMLAWGPGPTRMVIILCKYHKVSWKRSSIAGSMVKLSVKKTSSTHNTYYLKQRTDYIAKLSGCKPGYVYAFTKDGRHAYYANPINSFQFNQNAQSWDYCCHGPCGDKGAHVQCTDYNWDETHFC
jgi:hypothetical protein